jgi:hypothetical protein
LCLQRILHLTLFEIQLVSSQTSGLSHSRDRKMMFVIQGANKQWRQSSGKRSEKYFYTKWV